MKIIEIERESLGYVVNFWEDVIHVSHGNVFEIAHGP